MKQIISLMAGVVLVLSFGIAYADDSGIASKNTDKMIRDDDLLRYNLDKDQGTVNQMPAEPETQGSGAGGIVNTPDNKDIEKKDTLKDEPGPGKAPEAFPQEYPRGY